VCSRAEPTTDFLLVNALFSEFQLALWWPWQISSHFLHKACDKGEGEQKANSGAPQERKNGPISESFHWTPEAAQKKLRLISLPLGRRIFCVIRSDSSRSHAGLLLVTAAT
jgi:hypothetical protein